MALKLGEACKADLILFSVQVMLIFVVVCASILNLTLEIGNQNLWTVILTSSLGYIMPNPKIKINNDNLLEKHDNQEINN